MANAMTTLERKVNKDSQKETAEGLLTKTKVPRLTRGSKARRNYDVAEGQPFTLGCPVIGFPKPEVIWIVNGQTLNHSNFGVYNLQVSDGGKKNGKQLSQNNSNVRFLLGKRLLYIVNVTSDDEGTYKCLAENLAGRAEKMVQVALLGESGPNRLSNLQARTFYLVPPRFHDIQTDPNIVVLQNELVALSCNVSGSPRPKVMKFNSLAKHGMAVLDHVVQKWTSLIRK
ncbi:unnamed protein product [Soboliphyme baturini]|uniref:Ig-like domain-containing protein n=1 Tax=Soboliphyme baturini TaxID=241478 RepID=A0A183IZK5_9BILA|nr:unnamed protein product [Soboliphyme baturini]